MDRKQQIRRRHSADVSGCEINKLQAVCLFHRSSTITARPWLAQHWTVHTQDRSRSYTDQILPGTHALKNVNSITPLLLKRKMDFFSPTMNIFKQWFLVKLYHSTPHSCGTALQPQGYSGHWEVIKIKLIECCYSSVSQSLIETTRPDFDFKCLKWKIKLVVCG